MAIAVGWCPTLIARDSSQPDADQDAAELAARLYSSTLLIPPPGIEQITDS